ncbi:MAG: MerR family transcriptional regulator [Eubacteriaceae bacterium]|jgi:DNA-binding transcriptional MerR regulator|nr:MerR family transcriptional regulator [Eubacteriaceae bacterium]
MLMREVIEKTKLTRKAIEYYEEKGFIHPARGDNNYRIYSAEDVKILKEISLFRKLGCSIEEIKEILSSQNNGKLAEIIRKREIDLELENKKVEVLKLIIKNEDIHIVEEELDWIEKQETMYSRLMRIFPGYIGQAFFMAYKPFLDVKLKKEDEKYFDQYIRFLDHLPELSLSEEEKALIEQAAKSLSATDLKAVNKAKIEAVEDYDKWFDENRECISQYRDFKQSEAYTHHPMVRILEKVREYLEQNAYDDMAVSLIRQFSSDYDAYYQNMLEANEKLLNQSDEIS